MIKEDRLKDSTLDDGASIYQQREHISEKEKWKRLKGKEKWEYFNNYYRNKIIISVLALAFVVYMIVTMLTPKVETKLFVAVINSAFNNLNVTTVKDSFGDILQVEKDSLEFIVDNSFTTSSSGEYSEYVIANETKLGTYIFAGDIDVMIVNEDDFRQYTYVGTYKKISDVLPSNLINELADEFVDAEVNLDDNMYDEVSTNTEIGTYGISLKNAKAIDLSTQKVENPILAIVGNTDQEQNIIEFIEYLFDLN